MTPRARVALVLGLVLPACARCGASDPAPPPTPEPSVASAPSAAPIDLPTPLFQARDPIERPSGIAVSADGRTVAFSSSGRVTADDSDVDDDVFAYDPGTSTLTRLTTGGHGPAYVLERGVSADGQRILFETSSAFVEDDGNGRGDVYVVDRAARSVERVSLGPGGAEIAGESSGAGISGDGRVVAFTTRVPGLVRSDHDDESDLFVRDLSSGAIERASLGPGGRTSEGGTYGPLGLSTDGTRTLFFASHLVPQEPPILGLTELDVYERGSHAARFGADLAELSLTSMTADGRVVLGVFHDTDDVVGLLIDLDTGTRTRIEGTHAVEQIAISPDGHVVAVVDYHGPETDPVRALRILRDGAEVSSRPLAHGLAGERDGWRSFAVANDATVVARLVDARDDGSAWSYRTCVAVLAPTPVALACSMPADHPDL